MNYTDLLAGFHDRPSRPPPPRTLIERLLVLGLRILGQLPSSHLNPREKQALSGYLFFEGPMIVHQVARGLREHAACFPDVRADPAEMDEGLLRASCWLSLREFGLMLVK